MKHLLFFLLSFSAMVGESMASSITISGNVNNPKGNAVAFRTPSGVKKCALDGTGAFTITFDLSEAAYGAFAHGKESSAMYFIPGTSVQIKIDADQFDESIQYSGSGAAPNNYLAGLFLLKEQTIGMDAYAIYKLEEAAFNEGVNKLEKALTQYYKNNQEAISTHTQFNGAEKRKVGYEIMSMRSKFEPYHAYFSKDKTFKATVGPEEILVDLNLNQAEDLQIPVYTELLEQYFAQKIELFDPDTYTKVITNEVVKLVQNQEVKAHLLFTYAQFHLQNFGAENAAPIITLYKENGGEQHKVDLLESKYQSLNKVSKGQPAPSFSYKNIEGKAISLADLKGNYVYIDLWATWCGPCRTELPFLEALQEEFKDQKIKFVSISIDDNEAAWRKMVENKEMKGIQLYAGGWDAKIIQDYSVRGIPRFILIDREGKIITSNAARPSGKIKAQILSLEGILP